MINSESSSSSVFKGMKTLFFGVGFAKLIGIVSIPILTRIYSPENFAIFSLYIAIISVLSPLISLRYDLSIPLPRRDSGAANIVAIAMILSFVSVLFLGIVLLFSRDWIFNLFSIEKLLPYWWVLILGSYFLSIVEIFSLWAIRKREYKKNAKVLALKGGLDFLFKIFFYFLSFKSLGLVYGSIFSNFISFLYICRVFYKDIKENIHNITVKRMLFFLRYYSDFPIYRLPSQLILVITVQAPLLFCSVMYDKNITGQFSLAISALALPVALIGATVSNAYYAEISSLGRYKLDKIVSITKDVILKLFIFSLFPTVVLYFFGEFIFEHVFSHQWKLAGNFASSLSIILVSQFLQLISSKILFLFDGHKLLLILSLQRAAVIMAVILYSYFWNVEALFFVKIYSVILSMHYLLSILYTVVFVRKVGKK